MTDHPSDQPQRPPTQPQKERESLASSLAFNVDDSKLDGRETAMPDVDTLREEAELPPVLPIGHRHILSDVPADEIIQTQIPVGHPRSSVKTKAVSWPSGGLPQIDGYQIQELVGRGGMGVVYRAIDSQLLRPVAIKILPSIRNTARARTRFESEARLLAQVDHPGVARIFEVATTGENPYIAMEFVEGQSLDRLAAGKPLEPRVAAEFVRQLAEALQACHQLGIIHRDVKPGNALIASHRRLKLTDFGLAKLTSEESEHLTRTGEIVGTPSYMAPEQASGIVREFGPQTDVYGAGAVLYELLTGRPPFAAPDAMQTLFLVLTDPPLSPRALLSRVPQDLETITLKCLEKQKQHRYSSAKELADDLDRYLRGEPIRAKPASMFRKTTSWIRRHPALTSIAAICLLVVFGTIWGISAHNFALRQELDRSQRLAAEGRNLSQWLLSDFTRVLESDEGLTSVRSNLAERTQQYLDAMLRELEGDDQVKLVLADSFIRLAELQGSPGVGSLGLTASAKDNLSDAADVLSSLQGKEQEDRAVVLKVMLNLNLAAIEMDHHGRLFDPAPLFQLIRDALENPDNDIPPVQRKQLRLELLILELQRFTQTGNHPECDRLIQELEKLGQILLADEESLEKFGQTFSQISRARYFWLERQSRSHEIIDELKAGLERFDRLAKGQSASLSMQVKITGIHNLLAQAYLRKSRFEDAKKHLLYVIHSREELLDRDRKNRGAHFNLAQAWQSLGEADLQAGNLDSAGEHLKRAAQVFEEYAQHLGESTGSHPETLDVFFALSQWYLQRGETEQARREVQKVVEGLQPHLSRNWDLRLRHADALLQLAAIDMIAYADLAELEIAQYFSKMEKIPASDEIKLAYDRAVGQLHVAIERFEALENEQELRDQESGQLARARKMLEFVDSDFEEKFSSNQRAP